MTSLAAPRRVGPVGAGVTVAAVAAVADLAAAPASKYQTLVIPICPGRALPQSTQLSATQSAPQAIAGNYLSAVSQVESFIGN